MVRSRAVSVRTWTVCLGVAVALGLIVGPEGAAAITQPGEVRKLLDFKEKMIESRGVTWEKALESWTCPPKNSTCDPW